MSRFDTACPRRNASLVPALDIIFTGSGEFGLPTLRTLVEAGHRIVTVVSQPDRPAGRGKKLTPTPVTQLAIERGLPHIRTADINNDSLPPADVMVVIAFGQKISQAVTNRPRLGSINLHASLLPKYRGAAPINWAILRGETITGNSVIRLAERMDAGAVLGQAEVAIGETETAGELHDRLAEDGAPLMLGVLNFLSAGTAIERPQDDTQATLAPKLARESARVDFTKPAEELARQIRGLYPWPGCRVRLLDAKGNERDRMTLVRARPVRSTCVSLPPDQPEGCTANLAGTILADLLVNTGDGAIEVIDLQPEGKKAMSLAAYRNGHVWETGMKLEPLA